MFIFVSKGLDFFYKQGFSFTDLKPHDIVIEGNELLTKKLENKIFFYECPPQTKTSFYLVLEVLSDKEFDDLRGYIWNENKADLVFTITAVEESNFILNLYYGKISPNSNISNYKLDSFKGTDAGNEKIDKINKWNFDSGLFWLNYRSFVDKVKKSKSIDKELIFTLERLKRDLSRTINDDEIVQALIDRTLYIKYLEDNHIINSYFYSHYFGDSDATYKELLHRYDVSNINRLFGYINEIFNNYLFVTPEIDKSYLDKNVLDLIYHSIAGTSLTGQLSLFDFKFNIIPVEFISYIYEVFLKKEQKENGIFYTPKKLAQLIIDDVIIDNKIGRVLDPSCGSGMFLIVAFQKLLENSPIESNNVAEKIEHRIRLLSENIFGIEKKSIAQRFTIFSLSLQIFRDLNPNEIKEFINSELESKNRVELFGTYSFFENIICHNSLDVVEKPFNNLVFDYIVGNPPFFEIKSSDDEISFLNEYKIESNKNLKAKDVVGRHQISQCFLIKIKDWSRPTTRFGFVCNSSNFYNDNSKNFQSFFYKNYNIEKIYELSKVKKILFENAKESVNALIFTNLPVENNLIDYYPIELGLFSEKPFELLVIQEDKLLKLSQEDIRMERIRLRDYLVGNQRDWSLIEKIKNNIRLNELILEDNKGKKFIHRGLEIGGFEEIAREFQISKSEWANKNTFERLFFLTSFKDRYSSGTRNEKFTTPLLKPRDIDSFVINSFDCYLGDISNFHRPRNEEIYQGKKILWNRIGKKMKAIYVEEKVYFDFDIYVLKLLEENYYYLVTSILNSKLIDYYININLRKRFEGSFPKIGIDDIKSIPIPDIKDKDVLNQISELCKKLTEREITLSENINKKLNGLIYDLYGLSYLERQRIEDYVIKNGKVKKLALQNYREVLSDTIDVYFENTIDIRYHHYTDFNLVVVGVYFYSEENKPSTEKVAKYLLNEIFEQKPDENFLASPEKIYAKDCIYIIRRDDILNWTETKAYEDGLEILNRA